MPPVMQTGKGQWCIAAYSRAAIAPVIGVERPALGQTTTAAVCQDPHDLNVGGVVLLLLWPVCGD